MEFPVINGQRYRIQYIGSAIIQELWGDYVINGVLNGNTITFTATNFDGAPTLDEVTFFIDALQVITVNQSYDFIVTNEQFVTAHGTNIKGTVVNVPQNFVPPITLDDLKTQLDAIQAIVLDIQSNFP